MVDVTLSLVGSPLAFRSIFGRKTRGEPARPTVGAQQRYLGPEYSAIQLDRFGRVVTPTVPGQPPSPPPTPGSPPSDTGVGSGGFLFAGPGTAWWGSQVASREDRVRRAPQEFPFDLLWQFRGMYGVRTGEYAKRIIDAEKIKRRKLRELEIREKYGPPLTNTLVAQAGAPDVPGTPDIFTGSIFRAVLRALWPFVASAIKGSKPKPPPAPVEEPEVGEIELPEPEEIPKELEREAERAAELGRPFILRTTRAVGQRIPRPETPQKAPERDLTRPATLPAPQAPGQISAPRPPVSRPQVARPSLPSASPATARPAAALAATALALPFAFTSAGAAAARVPLRVPGRTTSTTGLQTGQVTGSTSPAGFAQAQASRQATRKRECECQEVKRKRRRKGKCREGFFRELPGKTRYETWRTRECVTGTKLSEKET